jgi:glycosyltransferase involved in cell wall biosynthesis
MSDKVSVVIPARNEQYLQKTVDDIFSKAKGDLEVIAVLDGCWPEPIITDNPNLVLIHNTDARGMRAAINDAARIATGKYIMKADGHCMFAEGFDEILKADCEPNWMVVPSRYSLDADNWKKGRGPIDYLYITFPYIAEEQFGLGMHGKKWLAAEGNMGKESYYGLENQRKDILIDDIMAFQGSCWFMHKEYFFDTIGMLDEKWYNMYQEAQELICKVWLSGGRCVVNKKTWYAHWHKTGSGYGLSKQAKLQSEKESVEYWMGNHWEGQKLPFEWLIDKFSPVPTWPSDWKTNESYKKGAYNGQSG